MIEVDLLPLELRKKKKILFKRFFKTRLILTILGSLILFHLFIYTVTAINTIRLRKLKKSWQALSLKKEKIDQLKGRMAKINTKIPLIEQLISNRVLWSEKLNRISEQIVGGIWLNEITFETQRPKTPGESSECLIIRGSAASRTKDEPALIGRFMQNLKDDLSFSVDFTEIELGPIIKRSIKQIEVMDFILICRFKLDRA